MQNKFRFSKLLCTVLQDCNTAYGGAICNISIFHMESVVLREIDVDATINGFISEDIILISF